MHERVTATVYTHKYTVTVTVTVTHTPRYLTFIIHMVYACVCMCVSWREAGGCEKERERERDSERVRTRVTERESEREREKEKLHTQGVNKIFSCLTDWYMHAWQTYMCDASSCAPTQARRHEKWEINWFSFRWREGKKWSWQEHANTWSFGACHSMDWQALTWLDCQNTENLGCYWYLDAGRFTLAQADRLNTSRWPISHACLCMYLCMYESMHVFMNVCMSACISTYTGWTLHAVWYIHTCIHTYIVCDIHAFARRPPEIFEFGFYNEI